MTLIVVSWNRICSESDIRAYGVYAEEVNIFVLETHLL
jgi:hypothetical protein